MDFLSPYKGDRVLVRVYIQPRASRNAFAGIHDNAVKLAIAAPPVDGKANVEVIKFLSSFFRIKKKDLQIKHGLQSRRKSVLVSGVPMEEMRERIQAVSK